MISKLRVERHILPPIFCFIFAADPYGTREHNRKVLARLANKYDDYEKIGQGRRTNDALIAMSAARLGITVITANARDFMRLAEFRPFQWRVHDFRGS